MRERETQWKHHTADRLNYKRKTVFSFFQKSRTFYLQIPFSSNSGMKIDSRIYNPCVLPSLHVATVMTLLPPSSCESAS